jgi:hypothetical protein
VIRSVYSLSAATRQTPTTQPHHRGSFASGEDTLHPGRAGRGALRGTRVAGRIVSALVQRRHSMDSGARGGRLMLASRPGAGSSLSRGEVISACCRVTTHQGLLGDPAPGLLVTDAGAFYRRDLGTYACLRVVSRRACSSVIHDDALVAPILVPARGPAQPLPRCAGPLLSPGQPEYPRSGS